jgi:hypothetical protein
MNPQQRRLAFLGVCVTAAAISVAYFALGPSNNDPGRRFPATRPRETVPLDRLEAGRPGVLFRSTVPDATFGRVAFVPLTAIDGPWHVTTLACDRVHFQGGAGVCVTQERSLTTPHVVFPFDEWFHPGPKRPLSGVPSRARVSADGRRAAITVFESGHSYAEGGFSTRTTLIAVPSGEPIADLEKFTVLRDGVTFKAPDFNFWGVTFARDGNRFYATLQSRGTIYLIEGDVDRREAHVVGTGVECPSLSPDNQRLAFKKRLPGAIGVHWQAAILDLSTRAERVLDAEPHSVDDQIEWLDDSHILYHLSSSRGADIWVLRTDRPEPPRIFIPGGYSPAVLR